MPPSFTLAERIQNSPGLPVQLNGQAHAAVLAGLEIVVEVAIGAVEVHDALVAPEVDGKGLQTRQVRPEIGDSRILNVAKIVVFEDIALHVGKEHALIARGAE